jgi:hypothetical protein
MKYKSMATAQGRHLRSICEESYRIGLFEEWFAGIPEPSVTKAERNTALAEWAMSDSCGYFEIWYMREKEIRAFEAASGAAMASGPAPSG